MKKNLANAITLLRIIGSFLLIFSEPMSADFLAIYAICGVSDMVDGAVARLTKSESVFGDRLDSFADMLFFCISLFHLLPTLRPPIWAYCCGISVAICRTTLSLREKRLFLRHTVFNKITGFSLYLLPIIAVFVNNSAIWLLPCICAAVSCGSELFKYKHFIK